VIPSSRHIKVEVNGEVVAESKRPYLLFETGLPIRYYLPQEDVRMDRLTTTDTQTACPYKGVASYWAVQANGDSVKDIVWGYLDPIQEAGKIKNLVLVLQLRKSAFTWMGSWNTNRKRLGLD